MKKAENIVWREDLSPAEIQHMTSLVSDIYRRLPSMIVAPDTDVFYVGDLHGELKSALAVQDILVDNSDCSVMFLGDYADRGPQQVETFNLVMSLALQYPKRVFMLRGNHESSEIARVYGFYSAISERYSLGLFESYCRVFEALPLAALSQNGIFACHGGVPEHVTSSERIQEIDRFHPNFPDDTAFQLVWNDPREADFHFRRSYRSDRAREFGRLAFEDFVSNLGIRLMIRAHEAFEEGYQDFFDGRLMSVFSASYGGTVKPKVIRARDGRPLEVVEI
jgi:predicted phosphodiesterase